MGLSGGARVTGGACHVAMADLQPRDRRIAEEAVDPLDDLGGDMLHHRRMRAATTRWSTPSARLPCGKRIDSGAETWA